MGSFCFHSVLPFIWVLVSFQDVSSVRAKADLSLHPLSDCVSSRASSEQGGSGYGLGWEQSAWAGHLPFLTVGHCLPYLLMPAYFCLRAGVCMCAHITVHRLSYLVTHTGSHFWKVIAKKDVTYQSVVVLVWEELGLPSMTKMVACMKSWLQFLCIWLFANIFQMWSPPQWPYLQRWEILMGRPRSAWPVKETWPLPQVIYVYVGVGWLLGWMLAVVYLFFSILVCTHVCMCE